MATGRSDYPTRSTCVLCFPFIFRGALDVGATTITDQMKLAAVKAIAELARAEQSTSWWRPTARTSPVLGPDASEALRPAPDRQIAPGARAAWRSGVVGAADLPISTPIASSSTTSLAVTSSPKPVFQAAKRQARRSISSSPEDGVRARDSRSRCGGQKACAARSPIGRPDVSRRHASGASACACARARFRDGQPDTDPRYDQLWGTTTR